MVDMVTYVKYMSDQPIRQIRRNLVGIYFGGRSKWICLGSKKIICEEVNLSIMGSRH